MPNDEDNSDSTAVIAKCLAWLCLHESQANSGTMLEKAAFLQRFGLTRNQAAAVLGTTDNSLSTLARQSKGKKGAKHAKAK